MIQCRIKDPHWGGSYPSGEMQQTGWELEIDLFSKLEYGDP